MISTFLQTLGHDWLILGGNGSIGSALIHELRSRCQEENSLYYQEDKFHSHKEYLEAALALSSFNSCNRPFKLIYCGGRGGFGIKRECALQQQKYFELFCQTIKDVPRLEKVIIISSFGAYVSITQSPYQMLCKARESILSYYLGDRSLILRLPSMYGWNRHMKRYHGLIGLLLMNLFLRRPTSIYARMETRRNYVSTDLLWNKLIRQGSLGSAFDHSGAINICACTSLSVFDICSKVYRATRIRPLLRLLEPSNVYAEHHFQSGIESDTIYLNDSLERWIKWQWRNVVRLSQ